MSAENEALARRFFEELCNQRNGAVADEIVSHGHVSHGPQVPPAEGPNGVRARIGLYQARSTATGRCRRCSPAAPIRVVVRWVGRGTHVGELMGIPPTGATIACEAITIFRVTLGRLAEEWTVWDALGLLQQVGALPEPVAA